MARQSIIQRALAGGELAPALHVRADTVKYLTGLRRCRNFVVQRHGGIANRAGTRYINACKTTAIDVILLRYVSENIGESMLLELGNGYLRFYLNGAILNINGGSVAAYNGATNYVIGDLVVSAGVYYWARVDNVGVAPPAAATWHPLVGTVFELPSPFGTDLPHWNQSGRTITLTHKNKAPWELINGGTTTSWILRAVGTASATPAPTGLALVSGGAGTLKIGYVVTAAATDTYEESLASGQVINAASAQPTPAAPDVLTWAAVTGAAEYYVYQDPAGNGTYGFLGTRTGATGFRATSITPDFSITPPQARVIFASAGNYPDRSANFQQRRIFGYTANAPDGIFGSKIGYPSNFQISQPLQDDDAVTFRLAGNNHHPIRHLMALKNLIVLTGGGAWRIAGGGPGQPITPSAIDAEQETYTGIASVVPVVVGNAIIYVEKLGSMLFDLQFDLQVEGLGGRDLCIYADHLFKGQTIAEIDFAQNPDSVVWACRSDGTLLGMTYIREQEVWGWHRHDSGAACRFEHVCVVPEADGDTVYVITRRTINGGFKRQIERLTKRLIVVFDTDAFFVDCGLSYSGAPVNNVAGLGHLEGQIVAVVGDGSVIFNGDPAGAGAANFTITGGTFPVVFPASYSNIHVGLQITAEVETLDLDVQGEAVRDRLKKVGSLTLMLEASARSFTVGPDSANLTPLMLETYESAVDAFTGNVDLTITGAFNDNGRVFIRHTDALPLTILGIMPNVEVGG